MCLGSCSHLTFMLWLWPAAPQKLVNNFIIINLLCIYPPYFTCYLICYVHCLHLFIIFACVFKNVNKLDSSIRHTKIPGGECHKHENLVGKEMKRFGASIVFGVLAWMLADMQMNHGSLSVHVQWFSTGRSEQTIMTS